MAAVFDAVFTDAMEDALFFVVHNVLTVPWCDFGTAGTHVNKRSSQDRYRLFFF